MTTSPQERCSERLHCMVTPSTKESLDLVARHHPDFKTEAQVVRHILELGLPMLVAELDKPKRRRMATLPRDASPEEAHAATEQLRPAKFPASALPRVTRDMVERHHPYVLDQIYAERADRLRDGTADDGVE